MPKENSTDGKSTMDAELWGKLQHHIGLEKVYAKLPFREFFQLRLVCKDWNNLASDRAFLEDNFKDPIPKPYFVLNAEGAFSRLYGLLTCDVSSGLWSWTRLCLKDEAGVFACEGLIYSYDAMRNSEHRVFNVHTKVWHMLPQALEITLNYPFVGMAVDTSARPYTFKVIVSSDDVGTQVYDSKSNSWETRQPGLFSIGPGRESCAHCDGVVYIRSQLDELLAYDMEKDVWSTLDPPPPLHCEDDLRDIGEWQGRLYVLTVKVGVSVSVWQLDEQSKQDWREVDRMPDELYSWLMNVEDFDFDLDVDVDDITILTSFCNEYVLVYAWLGNVSKAKRFVLCNLATKDWKKVDLPVAEICVPEET